MLIRKKFVTILLFSATLILTFFSCRTQKKTVVPEEKVLPSTINKAPRDIKTREPIPFVSDWAGTTWIIRTPEDNQTKTFPGYKGFHLGVDGRLLLINIDMALGDRWTSRGNILQLDILDGTADLPIEGSFFARKPENSSEDQPDKVQLVPELNPESAGLIFERADGDISIVENHWTPIELAGGHEVRWPVDSEVNLILLPDMDGGYGVLGYGGVNRFRGGVTLKNDRFKADPLAMTRKNGPASDFENLFVQRISETTRFVQIDKDLFLFNETHPVAAFRVQLFE